MFGCGGTPILRSTFMGLPLFWGHPYVYGCSPPNRCTPLHMTSPLRRPFEAMAVQTEGLREALSHLTGGLTLVDVD